MKRKEPSMDLEKLYEDILQQRLNECLEIEKQKNKKIHNNKPTSTCTNDLLLPMNPIEVPQRKGPFLDIPSFGPLSSDLSASMSPLSPFIRANPFEHAFNPFAVSMLNNHHQHQQTNCSPQLIPPSFGGRLLPQYQQSPPQSPLIPTPQYQRQTSAPANLTPFTNKPTHQQLSPLIYDGLTTSTSNLNSRSSLIGKARRGRRPNVEPMPSSSINHQRISLEFDNNQHNNLESGESHQCGANGWQTTPGSGMNCQRKRCQNLYHAAKYRDRRRQRMEQLYNEKESMEKLKNVQLTKIATLNMQINNLIRQRTNDGNVTHIETNPIAPLIPIPFINDTNVSIPSNIFPIVYKLKLK
ncbi:hypothetical protein BLOT_010472 [Blomia tropicalis]|nr:hypothetical protein BLOT_010472 [Blomia tropicalis]